MMEDFIPLDEAERRVRQKSSAQPRNRIHLIPFDSIALSTERNYILKGVIPDEGLTVIWGPPKCGKSFFTCDIALHVALGWEWRGKRVKAGPVVYVAAEGAHGFRARIAAFRSERMPEEVSPVPFYLVPVALDLIGEHLQLVGAIRETLGTVQPALVVIDTLNRTLCGSENSDEDMSDYIKAADALRDAFSCAVVVVHHCGIEGSRPRGHTSLTGAVDAQIAVRKTTAGTITATVELLKDGQEGETFGSTLRVVDVGEDDDSDPITSCVIEPAESVAQAKNGTKTTGQAGVALNLLRKLIDEIGDDPPNCAQIPRAKRVVRLDNWRDYWRGSSPAGTDNPDSIARAFRRAVDKLQSSNTIGIWDGWAWIA